MFPRFTKPEMSLEEILENEDICKMEQKFSFTRKGDTFVGKYPLQPYMDGARGVYGGELIAQSVLAAYETLDNPQFQLHSLHSYFLNPGSNDSSTRCEVVTNNETKNFTNKTVKVIQEHTNVLVFQLTCSFTLNNSIRERKIAFAEGKTTRVPFEFITSPSPIFDQYINVLDTEENGLLKIDHTHDLITTLVPEYFIKPSKETLTNNIGDRRLGFFAKVNDKLPTSDKKGPIQVADLLYLSDSFYLGLITRTFGISLNQKTFDFFRVSLDHAVYIHDSEFDPTDWMYVDYRFSRMSNNRVLCLVAFYDRRGRQIASVIQEGLVSIDQEVWDQVHGGSYKL